MSDHVSRETNCCTGNIAAQIEQKKLGKRKNVRHGGTLCSCCYVNPPLPGQRLCRECHNAARRASYHRQQEELKRLRALEQEQQLSKGNDNGQGQEQGQEEGCQGSG